LDFCVAEPPWLEFSPSVEATHVAEGEIAGSGLSTPPRWSEHEIISCNNSFRENVRGPWKAHLGFGQMGVVFENPPRLHSTIEKDTLDKWKGHVLLSNPL
jgi:hypothetical protein